MRFWWVNHKKTFAAELRGGYIWSPKVKANGAKNQTYDNLAETSPGDVVFSYANTAIRAIGIVAARAMEKSKPAEFGAAGDSWANVGWYVPIDWNRLDAPLFPKEHIDRIAPLLPGKHSPIRVNGHGNESCYLASISNALGELLMALVERGTPGLPGLLSDSQHEIDDAKAEREILGQPIEETEKSQLIKARKGQGIFRFNVEQLESRCRLTHVADKRFLIASHIKPWANATNNERLDGSNGLLLAPHADRLFDRGWISFGDGGEVFLAASEIATVMMAWGLDPGKGVGPFSEKQSAYLAYHREHILRRGKGGQELNAIVTMVAI
ncbi:HNH endonuclease [Cupriavidus sp. NPDC089707]|uniref:HNH endonuclease n=1 Tax=Cupriavidus sp. NPDC089707 TaxID=3363963 RepID=UPI003830F82A